MADEAQHHGSTPRSKIVSLRQVRNPDGSINGRAYYLFRKERNKRSRAEYDAIIARCKEEAAKEQSTEEEEAPKPKRKSHRSCGAKRLMIRDATTDRLVPLTWERSLWYNLYICDEQESQRHTRTFAKKFRRRFRMPYESFQKLAQYAKCDGIFERWFRSDAAGRKATPLELLLLGALRYVGRGWTFDDLEEATGINEETHRQFFHVFIEWGSTDMYDLFVNVPQTKTDYEKHTAEFQKAAFNGCVGSTDATHIMMEKCSAWLAQAHKGPKLSMPSRTYNMTVNHRRRILSCTRGHPARWNDKTLQLYDKLLLDINSGRAMSDASFRLAERMPDGSIHFATYQGCWLIVDNGYLHWPVTMPPFKNPIEYKDRRWSEWLESMRKDVECTFGILKGRFRILKSGIRLHGVEVCDKIWLTCCMLHNMLLEVDGLEEGWEGIPIERQSVWLGDLGNHDGESLQHAAFAIRRLYEAQGNFETHDSSGMGRGNDSPTEEEQDDEEDDVLNSGLALSYRPGDTTVRVVKDLDFEFFRGRLVEHFDIAFSKNQIVWPTRNGGEQPS